VGGSPFLFRLMMETLENGSPFDWHDTARKNKEYQNKREQQQQ
jgi:hypothetical protein